MTDYYCDLGEGTWADNAGTSTGTAYTGPAGLQAAIRGTGNAAALTAGDTLYIKGTGDQSRLVWLDVDTDVSSWSLGESVRNDTGDPDEWVGVVAEVGYGGNNDQILVWLNDGFTEDDIDLSHGIYKSGPWNCGLDAKDTKGIEIDTNGGSAAGPISFVGVNSSWSEDGTQAILDADDLANYNVLNSGKDYLHFRNITGKDSAGDAFGTTSTTVYCHFVNCIADTPAAGGFVHAGAYWQYGSFFRCKATGFTTYGFQLYRASLAACVAYGGTGASAYGFYLSSCAAAQCVAYKQDDGYGAYISDGSQLTNCVLDSNKYGLKVAQAGHQIVGVRITNNTTHGITGAIPVSDLYCFYFGNGADFQNDIHLPNDDGASTRTTTGTVGYVDGDNATLADRDYSLASDAAARRQEVTL